ncbi:hypothetical protein ABKN59_011825 [Abortiporus biennis]
MSGPLVAAIRRKSMRLLPARKFQQPAPSSSTPVTPIIPTSTMDLPPELLLVVFEHLASDMYFYYSSYFGSRGPGSSTRSITDFKRRKDSSFEGFKESRKTVRQVCLVCKLWHTIGCIILYGRTILLSRLSIHQFRKTLVEFGRGEELGCYVKMMFIHDQDVAHDMDTNLDFRSPRQRAARSRKSITLILNRVELECLCFQHKDNAEIPLGIRIPDLIKGSSTFVSLRRLIIRSKQFFDDLFVHLSFPNLETLSLQSFSYKSSSPFPRLPKLKTIGFLDVSFHSKPKAFTKDRCPNLETLILERCQFRSHVSSLGTTTAAPSNPASIGIFDSDSPPFTSLHLYLSNPALSSLFNNLVTSSILANVRHLSLGHGQKTTLDEPFHPFAHWTFPRCLQSLTVVVKIRKNHPPSTGDVLLGSLEGEDDGGGGALKSVYDCLKRNAQLRRLGPHSTPPAAVVDTGNLELVVLSTWTSLEAPHQALKAAGKLIRKIRNLCDANGVVFKYDRCISPRPVFLPPVV